MAEQLSMFPGEDEAKYQAFVDKFKPKKTTDDCYTPDNIYRTVAAWVAREYGLDPASFVRPFSPGGDYETFEYPEGCVVVDNPPFSLLARIKEFYMRRGIRFFLFAPTLTLFSANRDDMCYIPCGVTITYANGAGVNTSFVTNLDRWLVRTAPDLYRAIKRVNDANEKAAAKQLPKYVYPDCVLTAAAERAAATVWELSERERRIVASLAGTHSAHTRPCHPERSASGVEGPPDPFDLSALMSMPKEAPDHA